MNKVNEELEEVGYKRIKVDFLVHDVIFELEIRN
jgi:hypothetical protein